MAEFEPNSQKPLEIRGHHLSVITEFLYDIEKRGFTVSQSVDELVDQLNNRRNSVRGTVRSKIDDIMYVNDVIGVSKQQEEAFKKAQAEFYRNFFLLPPDYPVRILVDEPDDLCRTCVVGNHCKQKVDPDYSYFGDQYWVERILSKEISPGSIIKFSELMNSLKGYLVYVTFQRG